MVIAKTRSRAGRTGSDRTASRSEEAPARLLSHLDEEAFGGGPDWLPAEDLPSFRPLVRGLPVSHRIGATLHLSARRSHASSPAHVPSTAPVRANAVMPSGRYDLERRRVSGRLWPVSLFLAGMAAGLVGGYAASTKVANNWGTERVRTLLAIVGVVRWPETWGIEQDGTTRSAIDGTIDGAHATERVAIEDNLRSDGNTLTQLDPPAEAALRVDVLPPEPGGHTEPWSNAGPGSVIIAPSTKDDSS